MRFAWLALITLTGCPLATGPSTGECNTDGDCAGNVCARDGWCHPPSEVREVKTTWTLRGLPASTSTCTNSRDLQIGFSGGAGGEEPLSYAPVPCENGQWLMDKLPRSYTIVELGRDGGFPDTKSIGSSGEVTFDLRF
jgi:hypothetical protein